MKCDNCIKLQKQIDTLFDTPLFLTEPILSLREYLELAEKELETIRQEEETMICSKCSKPIGRTDKEKHCEGTTYFHDCECGNTEYKRKEEI